MSFDLAYPKTYALDTAKMGSGVYFYTVEVRGQDSSAVKSRGKFVVIH